MSKERDDGKINCQNLHYDECMYAALVKHMKTNTPSESGCTAPWVMDGGSGTTKICKRPENINTTFWEAMNRVTNQQDDCPIPCKSLLVGLGAKNYKVLTILHHSHEYF